MSELKHTPGLVAFTAYNMKRGGLNKDGEKTPEWKDLPEEIREGWEAAALGVIKVDRDYQNSLDIINSAGWCAYHGTTGCPSCRLRVAVIERVAENWPDGKMIE